MLTYAIQANYLSIIQQVPRTHGVYIFLAGNRPLYIGKSIQLRSRLQSHLRAAVPGSKTNRFVSRADALELIETSCELESLLLESHLIKTLLPIHNRQLRRRSYVVAIESQFDDAGYLQLQRVQKASSDGTALQKAQALFRSYAQAQVTLEHIQKKSLLCPQFLDLAPSTNQACYLRQLDRCSGSCVGELATDAHNQIFRSSLAKYGVVSWPFEVAQTISGPEGYDFQVQVNNWMITKLQPSSGIPSKYSFAAQQHFDLDTYKILFRHLRKRLTKNA